MKSSAILKKARKLIESGKFKYVCWAVEASSKKDKTKGEKIIKFISENIHPHTTLTCWINAEFPQHCIFKALNFDRQLRQTRLNWIDHMIKLYKAKKD
jgi:hypothetical protein